MLGLSTEEFCNLASANGLSDGEKIQKRFVRYADIQEVSWVGGDVSSGATNTTVVAVPAAATAAAPLPVPEVRLLPAGSAATASEVAPVPEVRLLPAAASATAAAPAPIPGVRVLPAAAAANASAPVPVPEVRILPASGIATASAPTPTPEVRVLPAACGATASAPAPQVFFSSTVTSPAATATASSTAPIPEVRLLPAAAAATASDPAPNPETLIPTAPGLATAASVEPVVTGSSSTVSEAAVLPMMRGLSIEDWRDIQVGNGLVEYEQVRRRFVRYADIQEVSWVGGDVDHALTIATPAARATAFDGGLNTVDLDVLPLACAATASSTAPAIALSSTLVPPAGLATASAVTPRAIKSHHFLLVPDPTGSPTVPFSQNSTGTVSLAPVGVGSIVLVPVGTGSVGLPVETPGSVELVEDP